MLLKCLWLQLLLIMCFNLYTAHNCGVPGDYEMTQELILDEEPTEDYDDIPDLFDDRLSTMYAYEDKGAPGASMYYDKTVEVSDNMQQLIVSYSSIFENMPTGPMYKCLPESLHHLLPDAFLHSYVIHSHHDKAKFDDLFKQHKEPLPLVIVMQKFDKMYDDVITDPESIASTIKALQSLDPTLANLLIDYFEAHTWSKHACMVYCNRSY